MIHKFFMKNKRGFVDAMTMMEILVVLVIIGILISIAVPNNTAMVTKAKSIEAQRELQMVQNLQHANFLQYSKYSNDLNQIGYIPHKLVTAGGAANYQISVSESSNTGFKARAESVTDFDGDGQMNIWEIDQSGQPVEIQKD